MKGNYAKIYRELDKEGLSTGKLRIHDMHLLAYLMDDCEFYKKEKGYYAPSQLHYAELFGTDVRTIRRMFNALVSMGLIFVVSHKKGCAKNFDVLSPENALAVLRKFNIDKFDEELKELKRNAPELPASHRVANEIEVKINPVNVQNANRPSHEPVDFVKEIFGCENTPGYNPF